MNLSLPQCMTVRSKRATKTKELNSETGGIEKWGRAEGSEANDCRGREEHDGGSASWKTDRQTQAGAAVLAGVGFFHLLVLDFFHFMMGL